MASHSSTLAWKIPWTEEPSGLQAMGSLRVRHGWATSLSCTGEGNGNPLQCSCLENPSDRGAWWAAGYGVAQSQTQLKWLSCSSSSSQDLKLLFLFLEGQVGSRMETILGQKSRHGWPQFCFLSLSLSHAMNTTPGTKAQHFLLAFHEKHSKNSLDLTLPFMGSF